MGTVDTVFPFGRFGCSENEYFYQANRGTGGVFFKQPLHRYMQGFMKKTPRPLNKL